MIPGMDPEADEFVILVRNRINEERAAAGISWHALEKHIGKRTADRLRNGPVPGLQIGTLYKIARCIGCPVARLVTPRPAFTK